MAAKSSSSEVKRSDRGRPKADFLQELNQLQGIAKKHDNIPGYKAAACVQLGFPVFKMDTAIALAFKKRIPTVDEMMLRLIELGVDHSHPIADPALGWRSLITVGFAGGMVPSPSALLVLLGAIALGRTWFGLLLVTAYGLGMAAMLTGAGLLLVRARGLFERRRGNRVTSRPLAVLGRFLPVATAAVIVVAGLSVAARAAGQI